MLLKKTQPELFYWVISGDIVHFTLMNFGGRLEKIYA